MTISLPIRKKLLADAPQIRALQSRVTVIEQASPIVDGLVIDVATLETAFNAHHHDDSYAAMSHGHGIGDVAGLQTELDGLVDIASWDDRFWHTLKAQCIPVGPPIWVYYGDPARTMYFGLESTGARDMAIARHVLPPATAAGQAADDVWYQRELNTLWTSSGWGASLSSDLLTLPAGNYVLDWWVRQPPVRELRVGVFDASGNPLVNQIGSDLVGAQYWRTAIGRRDWLELSSQTSIGIRAYHNYAVSGYPTSNKGTHNTSPPSFDTVIPNVYTYLGVERL